MIIIDNRVYLHIVKTGGTSIKRAVLKHRSDDVQFEWQHGSANRIPPEFKHFEKIALVRNPYDWYKSYYDYILWKKNGKLLAERMAMKNGYNKSNGYVSFDIFLNRALNFQDFIIKYNVINDIKKNMKKCGRLFFYSLWGDLTKTPDYKTFYQFHLYGAIDKETKVFKMEENIKDVFTKLKLEEIKVNVSPKMDNLTSAQKNKIFKADRMIFEEFNYNGEN